MVPACNAATNAGSSTTWPRAVLIRIAVDLICANVLWLISLRLVGLRSQFKLIKSARESKSLREVISTPTPAMNSGSIWTISFPSNSILKALALFRTALPIFPTPITPNVHSLNDRPGSFSQRPTFISWSIQGWRLAKASI